MQYTEAARKSGKLYCNTLYCITEKEAWRVEFGLQYIGVYCNRGGWVGLELYCNTVIVLQAGRLGWLVVSQYSKGVLWLGKGLLGESRYKICIVTEAASLAGCAGWAQAGAGRRRARAERGEEAGARGGRRTSAQRAAWAGCWAMGCALGALSLFLTRFDSVMFLSQFLDIVREPGS